MKVAVTVISYNQIKYLGEAINSVLRQTLKPDYILIIDDNSNDGSQELIQSYKAKNPHLIDIKLHSKNYGISYCRNEAIYFCKGDLHTFLDGDDRFLSDKIEQETILMKNNNYDVIVFGNVDYIDESGKKIYTWSEGELPPTGDIFVQVFSRDFPKKNLFRSELIKKEAYIEAGNYDMNLYNLYEDYDMRIRLAKKYKGIYCNKSLSEYRLHSEGLSRKCASDHIRALKYIYNKNKSLLDDLPASEKKYVKKRYINNLGMLSFLATKDAVKRNNYREAFKYGIDYLSYKKRSLSMRD